MNLKKMKKAELIEALEQMGQNIVSLAVMNNRILMKGGYQEEDIKEIEEVIGINNNIIDAYLEEGNDKASN